MHNYGTNQSVRFIIENPGNQPHPMHLHGHNIFVLQEGPCAGDGGVQGQLPPGAAPSGAPSTNSSKRDSGSNYGAHVKRDGEQGSCWDGSIVNPENPQRRDVQMLLPGSYIVIQWFQDNPGMSLTIEPQ